MYKLTGNCIDFFSSELAEATKNYCKASQIGKGGFGTVYKGTLRRSLSVAIKVLSQVHVYYMDKLN